MVFLWYGFPSRLLWKLHVARRSSECLASSWNSWHPVGRRNSQLLRWKMGLHPKIRIWSQNPVMGCETWFSVHISTRTRLLTHVRTFSRIWKFKVYIIIYNYQPLDFRVPYQTKLYKTHISMSCVGRDSTLAMGRTAASRLGSDPFRMQIPALASGEIGRKNLRVIWINGLVL